MYKVITVKFKQPVDITLFVLCKHGVPFSDIELYLKNPNALYMKKGGDWCNSVKKLTKEYQEDIFSVLNLNNHFNAQLNIRNGKIKIAHPLLEYSNFYAHLFKNFFELINIEEEIYV